MSKFVENLAKNNKAIRKDRAKMIGEDVLYHHKKLVMNLEDKQRGLKRDLMDLEDLSPDTVTSLNPTRKDFDAEAWVGKVQEIKVKLANVAIELQIAEETSREWFSESGDKEGGENA